MAYTYYFDMHISFTNLFKDRVTQRERERWIQIIHAQVHSPDGLSSRDWAKLGLELHQDIPCQ